MAFDDLSFPPGRQAAGALPSSFLRNDSTGLLRNIFPADDPASSSTARPQHTRR
jgi:hypothetical protein